MQGWFKMANNRLTQHVAAGVQFLGGVDNGLFKIPNAGGVNLVSFVFEGGTEIGKNLTVRRVDHLGNVRERLYEKTAFAESEILVAASIPLGPGETIQVVTSSLTAEAAFSVYYE